MSFTPTQWMTVKDKEKYFNDLIKFVKSGYKEKYFTKSLYQNLSVSFGHIAENNKFVFYDKHFGKEKSQERWVKRVLKFPSYGSPHHTRADVEDAFKGWLNGFIGR